MKVVVVLLGFGLVGCAGRPASEPGSCTRNVLVDAVAPSEVVGDRRTFPLSSALSLGVMPVDGREFELELRETRGASLANGRVPLEQGTDGFYWKALDPVGVAALDLHVPGFEQLFAIDVAFRYWGGAGAGLLGDQHRVAHVVGRRGVQLELLLTAVYLHTWSEYPGCEAEATNACMEQVQARTHSRSAELVGVQCPGGALEIELRGPGSTRRARWSPATRAFEPSVLELP